MWNDKSLTWERYGLRDRKEIQAEKPPLGEIVTHKMESKLFFTENTRDSGSIAYFKDLQGYEIELTQVMFKKIGKYYKRIPEILNQADEIYLQKFGEKLKLIYVKFYQETSLVLNLDFNNDQALRIRSIKPFKGATINDHRKGVKVYG